ncbi:MAG: PKD domain-containing protein [Thermoleophilaceae bacterium]|nr:PKD domain-containing protein [Thermoleophilaceae bacterium]
MRRALLGVAVLASFIVLPSVASAADVTVVLPRGGGEKTVSLDSLSAQFDVYSQYALVGSSGKTTSKQIRGISLRALLDAVGADPTYSAVEIGGTGGSSVRISHTQIEADGATPPVVYSDGGVATFVRPSYGAADKNAGDVVSGQPLVLTQVDGTDYGLKAKASKSKASVGESIKFTASAIGAAGQELVYSWVFNDGSTGTGANVSHRFKKRGYYRVLVAVKGAGETTSTSMVLKIQVGKASASKQERSGAGTNDNAAAPVSGQADGASGSGDSAGSQEGDAAKSAKTRTKQDSTSPPALAEVTGQLVSATAATPQQSGLAARSGQPNPTQEGGPVIPKEALGGLGALGLLGFGAFLELGGAAGLRRRISA